VIFLRNVSEKFCRKSRKVSPPVSPWNSPCDNTRWNYLESLDFQRNIETQTSRYIFFINNIEIDNQNIRKERRKYFFFYIMVSEIFWFYLREILREILREYTIKIFMLNVVPRHLQNFKLMGVNLFQKSSFLKLKRANLTFINRILKIELRDAYKHLHSTRLQMFKIYKIISFSTNIQLGFNAPLFKL